MKLCINILINCHFGRSGGGLIYCDNKITNFNLIGYTRAKFTDWIYRVAAIYDQLRIPLSQKNKNKKN